MRFENAIEYRFDVILVWRTRPRKIRLEKIRLARANEKIPVYELSRARNFSFTSFSAGYVRATLCCVY